MKNLIKVVNPNVANKLVALGFSYIKEQNRTGNQFVFIEDIELIKILNSQFSKTDYYCENKLKF